MKKTWYWVIGILLFIFLIGFLLNNNEKETGDVIYGAPQNNSVQNNLASPYESDCPKILIPDRFDLNCSRLENENWGECYYKSENTYYWDDGYEMDKVNNLNFRVGSWEGENVNYLYSHSYNIYEEKEVLEDGTIKWNEYVISFILDLNNKNEKGYKTIKYRCHNAEDNSWRNVK